MANDLETLDALVAEIRAGFQGCSEEICRKIEDINARAGHPRALDRIDQARFLSALYTIVRTLRLEYVLQTGTCVGDSALAVALALEDCRGTGIVETIDPEPMSYGGLGPRNPVALARAAVAAAGLSGRVVFHHGYSVIPCDRSRGDLPPAPWYVLPWLASRPRYDFLIVDGDHSFHGVFGDLEYGTRCLRPHGPNLILVHDYHGIPTVRSGVREWLKTKGNITDFRAYDQGCGFALIQARNN
jgi:Methyltransferase domain